MRKAVQSALWCGALCLSGAGSALAGGGVPDFSGTYDCVGKDRSEGDYTGRVDIEKVVAQSAGDQGAYRFTLEVPGYGAYPGFAATSGRRMAVYFANAQPDEKDYGVGIASFQRNGAGRWTFRKFYFEPEYKGGNRGTENCTQRP